MGDPLAVLRSTRLQTTGNVQALATLSKQLVGCGLISLARSTRTVLKTLTGQQGLWRIFLNVSHCAHMIQHVRLSHPVPHYQGNVEWAEAGPIWRRTKRATIQTTGLPIELGRFHDDKDRIYEKLKKPLSYMGSLFCFPRLEP